jgi:hypothetical protein
MVYHALAAQFRIDAVIVEAPVRAAPLLMRRAKKIASFRSSGRFLFRMLVVPALRAGARERIE